MSKTALKRVRRALGMEVNRKPLDAYAWPGGYPILYLDGGNDILCAVCATKAAADEDPKMRPCAWQIHYEGESEFCADCNVEIESAYGNPD